MNNINITIRKSNENDIKELRELFFNIRIREFSWSKTNEITLQDFDKVTEGEVIFVADIGNKVIGFASIWVEDKFIHNLFINKEYRKLGVGKLLVDAVKLKYGTPLTLKCVKLNQNAVNFYNHNGWIILKEELDEEGAYYLMSLLN